MGDIRKDKLEGQESDEIGVYDVISIRNATF